MLPTDHSKTTSGIVLMTSMSTRSVLITKNSFIYYYSIYCSVTARHVQMPGLVLKLVNFYRNCATKSITGCYCDLLIVMLLLITLILKQHVFLLKVQCNVKQPHATWHQCWQNVNMLTLLDSVVEHSETCHDTLTMHVLLSQTVKEWWKSANIYQSYKHMSSGMLYWLTG